MVGVARPQDDWRKETSGLDVALATMGSFQGVVQHADEKVRTLVAVHGGLTAFMTAQLGLLAKPALPSQASIVGITLLGVFVAGSVLSGVHLFQALRSRTAGPSEPNRFAFPNVAAGVRPLTQHDDLNRQCAEAWRVAKLLAELAVAKHRHVNRALMWTVPAIAASIGSLVLLAAVR
ncbi:hypothetical protein [Saccharopolyspora taberi]|uniref:Pycsar effector protein domain-containing protein n=1 Tax=Saccharopolyspora taberi TaxID=60895 RepID=A0ABN3VEH9_9PSEU